MRTRSAEIPARFIGTGKQLQQGKISPARLVHTLDDESNLELEFICNPLKQQDICGTVCNIWPTFATPA